MLHVNDVAAFGEPVDEGGGEMIVFEKGAPFAEAQIGGDERGLFFVPLVHESEEEPDLGGFGLDVPQLIDEQALPGQIFFEHSRLGVVGGRTVELGDDVGKQDVVGAVALVDGMEQKAGGQAGLANACPSEPDDVLVVFDVAQGVVEGHYFLLVELGLAIEGKGFNDPRFGDAGAFAPELARVFLLEAVFFLHHVGEQVPVGEVALGGQSEIVVPMGE